MSSQKGNKRMSGCKLLNCGVLREVSGSVNAQEENDSVNIKNGNYVKKKITLSNLRSLDVCFEEVLKEQMKMH